MKTSLAVFAFTATALATTTVPAQSPQQRPAPTANTTLRLSGDAYMSSVVLAWEHAFQRQHHEVAFENNLIGTDSAVAGIYGTTADLALLGRESNQVEEDSFFHSLQYKPLELHLMTGSLDAFGKTAAPVLFVHQGNPLSQLTLQQVQAAFGCGEPSHPMPAHTWGQLGATGAWKNKPLHLYMADTESGTGVFFVRKVQGENKKMNWPVLKEFSDIEQPDGTILSAAEQAMNALRHDPYGLALSTLRYADAEVKPLALAAKQGGPYVLASRETLINGSYPLARMTFAFVNQPPGKPLPQPLKEFLTFIYSEEGQRLVSASPGFLSLAPADAAAQVRKLR